MQPGPSNRKGGKGVQGTHPMTTRGKSRRAKVTSGDANVPEGPPVVAPQRSSSPNASEVATPNSSGRRRGTPRANLSSRLGAEVPHPFPILPASSDAGNTVTPEIRRSDELLLGEFDERIRQLQATQSRDRKSVV